MVVCAVGDGGMWVVYRIRVGVYWLMLAGLVVGERVCSGAELGGKIFFFFG